MRKRIITARSSNDWRGRKISYFLTMILAIDLFGACALAGTGLGPGEEAQIKNVVEKYYVRDARVPQQAVEIQKVFNHWARVSIRPVGVENSQPVLFFLQNQAVATNDAPVAQTTVQPGYKAPVKTETGWAIILGPKARFTKEELDAAGVPLELRP